MENTTTQTNQKFSAANKKSLKVGQELTEHGLIWRKLQDGTGVWRYDFRMNKRRFKGVLGKERQGVTLSAARNQLKELKARYYLFQPKHEQNSGFSRDQHFEIVAETYLEWARINRKGFRQTQGRMTNQLIPYFEGMKIEQINARTVTEFQTHLLRKGYSNNTVRLCMSLLSSIFNHMQLTDMTIDNPVKKVAKPSKTTNVIKTISDEQFNQLLTACNGDLKYQAAIGLAYYAGLRASEILGLEWDQVDLENKTITICKRVVEGKLDNTTKSGRSRVIPISGSLLRILQTFKFDDKQNRYLISNKNGSHYHHIQNVFSRLKSRIALDFDGGIHVLRHTFATNAVTNGVNLPVVQKWMGHSDIKTTMGYVHITDKHSAEQMQLMK